MFRKVFTVITLAIASLFAMVGVASATDYVPPAVTTGIATASPSTSPTGTGIAGGSLSYTGTGFNVGGAVAIGAIVLLVGIGLCIAGARFAKGRSAQH